MGYEKNIVFNVLVLMYHYIFSLPCLCSSQLFSIFGNKVQRKHMLIVLCLGDNLYSMKMLIFNFFICSHELNYT